MHLATLLARKAREGPGAVVTHVVGIVGDSISGKDMAAVAAAGDGKVVFVEANASLETVLFDALIDVSRGCAYQVSSSTAKIVLADKLGGQIPLENVENDQECAKVPLSWYADSQTANLIVLCPEACERAAGDDVGVVAWCDP